ncbi:MAG: GC-type dockerin domain-anchored protein, partial [Planctomycetota bacterium]
PDTGAGSAPIVDMGAIERQRCPADFAAPFATLDVFDVIEYLGLFDIADPAADLAAPLGVFDFADILEYLGLFDTGCEG